MDYQIIFDNAVKAATIAQLAYISDCHARGNKWRDDDINDACGFAWVKVIPARGPFVTWLKKKIAEAGDDRRQVHQYGSKAYEGGWQFWAPGSYNGQSISVKEVGAIAFAKTLKDYGIDAYMGSRLD